MAFHPEVITYNLQITKDQGWSLVGLLLDKQGCLWTLARKHIKFDTLLTLLIQQDIVWFDIPTRDKKKSH